ncbi:hypothetical protein [Streptomyces racemochromogenes]|uniref:hypothetical protein n=1 Tax=Streptomyces racemochromogenes TaxID=67353 RepID=UPI0035EC6A11
MSLHGFKITPDELTEILARLQPYMPEHLAKVEPHSYGLRYEFRPFTGREAEPLMPSTHEDPKLRYVAESQDPVEHELRLKAGAILADVYQSARDTWKDAAYVAALKKVIQDGPVLWEAYQTAESQLSAAYEYLRTPQASAEWPSAVSRLVDAQDRTKAAAVAFDERAQDIAQVHRDHVYAPLGREDALKAAGYPEASGWHIADPEDYHRSHYSNWGVQPLGEQVRRLIERQDGHVAKVGRLSGTSG